MNFRAGLFLATCLTFLTVGCAPSQPAGQAATTPAPQAQSGEELEQGESPRQNEMTRAAASELDRASEAETDATARPAYEAALEAAEAAIQTDDTNPLPYYQAGQAQIGLGNYAEADSLLSRATELRPIYELEIAPLREQTWFDLYQEAAGLIDQGDIEAARPIFEGANRMYRERPEVMVTLGQIYTQTGDYDAALEQFETAREVIADESYREGRDSVTIATWEEQGEQLPLQIAQVLLNAQRYEEASGAIEDILEGDPGNLVLTKTLASLYVQRDQADSAAILYQDLLARPDLAAEDYYEIGIGLYQMEEYEQAADAFMQAPTAFDRDAAEMAAISLQLAHPRSDSAQVSTATLEELREVAEQWLEIDPYSRQAHIVLAQTYSRLGNEDGAGEIARRLEGLSVVTTNLELRRDFDGGGTFVGQLMNVNAEPGQTVTVTATFVDRQGNTLGTESTTVQTPAEGQIAPFQIQFQSDQPLGGNTYDIQM